MTFSCRSGLAARALRPGRDRERERERDPCGLGANDKTMFSLLTKEFMSEVRRSVTYYCTEYANHFFVGIAIRPKQELLPFKLLISTSTTLSCLL